MERARTAPWASARRDVGRKVVAPVSTQERREEVIRRSTSQFRRRTRSRAGRREAALRLAAALRAAESLPRQR